MTSLLMMRAPLACRTREGRWLGDALHMPQCHDLWITAVAVRGHRGLELHPIALVQRSHLRIEVLAEEQRHVGEIAAAGVASRVHPHHHDALRAHKQHLEALADYAHLALPLERSPAKPVLKGLSSVRAVTQRSARAAVEEEVLPSEHRRRPLVHLVRLVESHGGPENVDGDDDRYKPEHDRYVLPGEDDGATADLEGHHLGAEGGEADPGLPRDDVEATRAVMHHILEGRPE
mmetsp:Transcript_104607/g.223584  ORF Transcript_104607/g.223584 Transcript_104607/m.223584 type:complete len:233 (-) Transcript_104607:271-969(-)